MNLWCDRHKAACLSRRANFLLASAFLLEAVCDDKEFKARTASVDSSEHANATLSALCRDHEGLCCYLGRERLLKIFRQASSRMQTG